MSHRIRINEELSKKLSDKIIYTVNKIPTEPESVSSAYTYMVDNLFKELSTPNETLLHAVVGISGKSGKLLDAVKESWIYGKELDVENLVEELADLYFYFTKILLMLGVSNNYIMAINMHKLAYGPNARFPEGVYTDASAITRVDKAEEIIEVKEIILGDGFESQVAKSFCQIDRGVADE